jgi:hypothetical protein
MENYYPASSRQIEDWHKNYISGKDCPPNSMSISLELESKVDIEGLKKCYQQLVKKNPVLRACFPIVKNEIVQKIEKYQPERFDIICEEDISFENYRCGSLMPKIFALKNLKVGPLVKAVLLKDRGNKYTFIFLIHHIISDIVSITVLKNEMRKFYLEYLDTGSLKVERSDELQCYLTRMMHTVDLNNQSVVFWQRELEYTSWHINYDLIYSNCAKKLNVEVKLPNKWRSLRSSDLIKNSKGGSITVCIEERLLTSLREFETRSKFSINIILLTCMNLLSYQVTNNKDVLIQNTFFDRIDFKSKQVIGNFLGTLLVRINVNLSASKTQFIQEIYQSYLDSIDNIIYNSEKLEKLRFTLNSFIYINFVGRELSGASKEYHQPISKDCIAMCPLYCIMTEYQNNLTLTWEFNYFYYNSTIISYLIKLFFEILDRLISEPEQPIGCILQDL